MRRKYDRCAPCLGRARGDDRPLPLRALRTRQWAPYGSRGGRCVGWRVCAWTHIAGCAAVLSVPAWVGRKIQTFISHGSFLCGSVSFSSGCLAAERCPGRLPVVSLFCGGWAVAGGRGCWVRIVRCFLLLPCNLRRRCLPPCCVTPVALLVAWSVWLFVRHGPV